MDQARAEGRHAYSTPGRAKKPTTSNEHVHGCRRCSRIGVFQTMVADARYFEASIKDIQIANILL
jgi:hypothetical protein